MIVEETEDAVHVTLNGQKLKYRKDDWSDEKNLLTDSGVVKLQEWKIDLVENHGVDLNEV